MAEGTGSPLPPPVQTLVGALGRECGADELRLLRKAKGKDVARVERKLGEGADPAVLFVELKAKLRNRRGDPSASSDSDAPKRRKGRSRSAERKKKKRRKRRSASRSSSDSSDSDSSSGAAARRREERRKRLAIPANMIATLPGTPLAAPFPDMMGGAPGGTAAGAVAAAAHTAHCRVYVGNIVFEVEETEIRQVFEAACGPIRNLEMSKDVNANTHRGYCFIEFVTPQGALAALEMMNGQKLHGRTIRVGRPNNATASSIPSLATVEAVLGIPPMPGHRFIPPGDPRLPPQQTAGVRPQAYVCGVPVALSDAALRAAFGQYGTVVGLIRRPDRYFAILEYAAHTEAEQAVQKMDGKVLHGCKVRLGRVVSAASGPAPSRCVVLLNMVAGPQDVDEALGPETKEHCDRYGAVEQVLIYDEVHAGTKAVEVKCFVLFAALPSAVRAQQALHGKTFGGRRVSCQFFAEEDFKRILES